MTPSMSKLRKFVTDEKTLKLDFDHLVNTIGSDDIKIPENARICACFLLKSFERNNFNDANVQKLKSIVTEGARNNFSLTAVAKTNIRAYFVDMRVQLLFLLVEHNLCDFDTLIECFNDYT